MEEFRRGIEAVLAFSLSSIALLAMISVEKS
jgi:hypothetical protein